VTRAASRWEGWPRKLSSRCLGRGCLGQERGQTELSPSPSLFGGAWGGSAATRGLRERPGRLPVLCGLGQRMGQGEEPFGQKPGASLALAEVTVAAGPGCWGRGGPGAALTGAVGCLVLSVCQPVPASRRREQPVPERSELLALSGGSCSRGLATVSRAPGKLCGERGCPRALAVPAGSCSQLGALLPCAAPVPWEAGGAEPASVTTHGCRDFGCAVGTASRAHGRAVSRDWPSWGPQSLSGAVRGARASAGALCPGRGCVGGCPTLRDGWAGAVRAGPSGVWGGTGCAAVLLSRHDQRGGNQRARPRLCRGAGGSSSRH